ncbi:hypothetical protein QR680_005629 [Steinernema hermaphroditum]|uniref:RRM domain-containing protein n=2 Tax=Steinernema hermaphroditum TaxID=289476 RepID=A0AA39HSR6_9BILA|nr:hypothetical protein QR680_005629 [Steinernema hermaphroditum]
MTNTRIYIGRLPQRASEQDVYRFFKGYGRIREVVIKNGFGFVEFSEVRDAEDAVFDLNGKELCGDRVVLEFSRRHPRDRDRGRFDDRYSRRDSRYGPPYQTPYRLLVENLSTRCSWQDLKDFMRDAGEVTYADAHKIQRREGIICFATRNSMERAMDKFQGKDINGRLVAVAVPVIEAVRIRMTAVQLLAVFVTADHLVNTRIVAAVPIRVVEAVRLWEIAVLLLAVFVTADHLVNTRIVAAVPIRVVEAVRRLWEIAVLLLAVFGTVSRLVTTRTVVADLLLWVQRVAMRLPSK